jgi:hypothetical protein
MKFLQREKPKNSIGGRKFQSLFENAIITNFILFSLYDPSFPAFPHPLFRSLYIHAGGKERLAES